MSPTKERLEELFDYQPESGLFFRKQKNSRAKAGSIAGHIKDNGYIAINVDGGKYHAHRLAWIYINGCEPSGDIDHIDGDRTNNRISNLRNVSRSTNLENIKKAKSHNKSTGILGAYPSGNGFTSKIQVKGKTYHLGSFKTVEQASTAYMEAKRKYHEGFVA